ncbi:MAG: mechanosensitive ion channel family protein [Acidimicrobiales bacterium]
MITGETLVRVATLQVDRDGTGEFRVGENLVQSPQVTSAKAQATDAVGWLLAEPLRITVIVLVAALLSRLGCRLARRTVAAIGTRAPVSERSPRVQQRAATLGGVAASAIRAVVWTLAALAILGEVGVNLGPLLAGASVVGVAVGFGAQTLVKDFVSGFFILAEDQYGVGDTVTVADVAGTVEEVNLRLTRLRAADGTVWFVPNGEIRKVANSAKGWSLATADVLAAPWAPTDQVLTAARRVAEELVDGVDWATRVQGRPEVHLESMTAESLTVRVSVRTGPSERVALSRELRAAVLGKLQSAGLARTDPSPDGATK